jgi:hypothetical protein
LKRAGSDRKGEPRGPAMSRVALSEKMLALDPCP